MSDNPSLDPFTRVLTRLWDVLLEDPYWPAKVKPGNRIGGDEAGAAAKRAHTGLPSHTQQLGEMYIFPSQPSDYPLDGTSSGVIWTQSFSAQMTTGSTGFIEKLFPLKNLTLEALRRARKARGPTFGLPELIIRVRTTDVLETNQRSDLNKDSTNWVGLLGIAVQFRPPDPPE